MWCTAPELSLLSLSYPYSLCLVLCLCCEVASCKSTLFSTHKWVFRYPFRYLPCLRFEVQFVFTLHFMHFLRLFSIYGEPLNALLDIKGSMIEDINIVFTILGLNSFDFQLIQTVH